VAENELVVEVREGAGKGVARKLRAAGRIPGVCYGRKLPSVSISLDPRTLEQLLAASTAGLNTLFQLRIAGVGDFDGKAVLVRELQRNPVDGQLLHADLYAVDLEKSIQVSVPIGITGSAEGVKVGGILDQALRTLELECMPQAIPREVVVEVSELEIGQTLHVRDIGLPEGVSLLSDPDLAVVSVVAPVAEEVEAPPEEEEVAEGEAEAAAAEGDADKAPEAQKQGEKESDGE
jgi:large subunit ribosomal protein L25